MSNAVQCVLPPRPHIPHIHVHADSLGEVFSCDSTAALSLREIGLTIHVPIFFIYHHHALLTKKMGKCIFLPFLFNSSVLQSE